MEELYTFEPPRGNGTAFHISVIGILGIAVGWLMLQASSAQFGPDFVFYLLGALVLAAPIPLFAYRLYALWRSTYIVARDGLRLRWGLRMEDIPVSDILWVYRANEVEFAPTLPLLRWPGNLVGCRGTFGVGEVEFMAAQKEDLVFIGTEQRVYAVTPRRPQEFVNAYQAQMELGSLEPIEPQSIYPTFVVGELWRAVPVRVLVLAGLLLNLALLIWVGVASSGRQMISLGVTPSGAPQDAVPAVQLYLLPVASAFFFAVNFILAMYYYRRSSGHPLAYLLWGSSVLTPLLFLIAVFFILRV
jgi:hypothetical protein